MLQLAFLWTIFLDLVFLMANIAFKWTIHAAAEVGRRVVANFLGQPAEAPSFEPLHPSETAQQTPLPALPRHNADISAPAPDVPLPAASSSPQPNTAFPVAVECRTPPDYMRPTESWQSFLAVTDARKQEALRRASLERLHAKYESRPIRTGQLCGAVGSGSGSTTATQPVATGCEPFMRLTQARRSAIAETKEQMRAADSRALAQLRLGKYDIPRVCQAVRAGNMLAVL